MTDNLKALIDYTAQQTEELVDTLIAEMQKENIDNYFIGKTLDEIGRIPAHRYLYHRIGGNSKNV